MSPFLKQLQAIIRELARREILPRFTQVAHRVKADGSLVTEADTAMQAAVMQRLHEHWPEYRLLGEEMSGAEQQVLLDDCEHGLWVLDPLDGTSNFAAGIPIFSVSLALILNGEVEFGLVYDPLRDESFCAQRGRGAWLNDTPMQLQIDKHVLKQCVAQVDLKRLSPQLAGSLAAQHPFASQRNFGSGTLDWCWLAAGRSQLYLHGGQKLWDYLAGHLILQEAGGQVTTLDGEALFNHSLQPRSVVAATTPELYRLWYRTIQSAQQA